MTTTRYGNTMLGIHRGGQIHLTKLLQTGRWGIQYMLIAIVNQSIINVINACLDFIKGNLGVK